MKRYARRIFKDYERFLRALEEKYFLIEKNSSGKKKKDN
jgi:hypothetical protein